MTNKDDKTFRLTEDEKRYIEEQSLDPKVTDEKIAKKLGRNPITIARYRKSKNIYKSTANRKISFEEINTGDKLKNRVKQATSDEERKAFYIEFFKLSGRAKKIRKIYELEDFEYFCDKWGEYHLQFNDMTSTEEDALEKLIMLDLRIIYNQKDMKQCQMVQHKLQEELSNKDELDPENDKDLQILQTINTYNGQQVELNKQLNLLLKEYNELQKSLNATREQREDNQRIGAETFFDLMKKMQNEEVREHIGRINELVKISQAKKLAKLKEPHKYLDGTYDLPILDGADIKRLKELEDLKNKEEKEKKDEN